MKVKLLLMMLFVFFFSISVVYADVLSFHKFYSLTPLSNGTYTDDTLEKLTDGYYNWDYSSAWWSGVYPVIVLDLGSLYTLQSVSMYVVDNVVEGIYPPGVVGIELSEDGVNFFSVSSITSFVPYDYIYCSKGTSYFADTLARYVRYSPSSG